MDIIFGKQIGYINYLIKGIKIRHFKKSSKERFFYRTITNNKYSIYKWDLSSHEVYMTNSFTDWGNEYLFLDSLSKRNKEVFIDVGCHTGYYPSLFKNYFSKIIGFEPNTKSISTLKNLNIENFEYFQNFVGDKNIQVNSIISKEGWSFYEDNKINDTFQSEKLFQITLDNFYENKNIKNISAIKIDIDGADLKVLYGAKKIIEDNKPSILIENYSSELFDFFNNLNYSFYSLVSNKSKPYNLTLEKLKFYDKSKWIKMVCCIPNEYSKNYDFEFFKGNMFTGINKTKLLNHFSIT